MKLKKIVAVATALTMAMAAVTGCGSVGKDDVVSTDEANNNESTSAEGEQVENKKYKICFVARASADTFAAWLTDEMENAAAAYDDIELTCVSGEGDDNTENGLLEDCITKGYDLVIVQSNNNAAQAPYVQKLLDAGIPVITTNPTTHQGDLDGSDSLEVMAGTGTVDADPVEQASVGAKRAAAELRKDANVVVLKGPSGNYHADKRREGWEKYFFAERPDVNIVGEDFANWNNDEAMTLMEAWVQKGTHIDAIISMNDNMAAGAIEAIRNNSEYVNADGTTTFKAYGVDGTAQGCQLIEEGLLTATALQAASDIAKMNMEYAVKVVRGEMDVTDVADSVPAPEINIDNVAEYIEMYKDNGQM